MNEENEEAPQLGRIQPIQGRDQVTIPGALNPAQLAGVKQSPQHAGKITAVRITRNHGAGLNGDAAGSILVGNRSLTPGEIIRITPRPVGRDGRDVRITDDMMPKLFLEEQALHLIRIGYAERDDEPGRVEDVIQPTHRTAEQAVRRPQRGQTGAI